MKYRVGAGDFGGWIIYDGHGHEVARVVDRADALRWAASGQMVAALEMGKESWKHCVDCGLPIPDDQKVCSMCCGDIDYGSDGYYRQWAEAELQREAEDREWEEAIEAERKEVEHWLRHPPECGFVEVKPGEGEPTKEELVDALLEIIQLNAARSYQKDGILYHCHLKNRVAFDALVRLGRMEWAEDGQDWARIK